MPTIQISGNTQITAGNSTTLTASGASTYVWSNGETTAAITVAPTSTTTYTVTGTTQYGCTATASKTVQVSSSVADYADEGGILLYPNPATHTVTLQADEGKTMQKVIIYDAMGRTVFSNEAEMHKVDINVSNWTSGIYFAHITVNGNVAVKKFTKE